MFTNKQDAALLGKENAWEVSRERVVLIKSLIYARWKEPRLWQGQLIQFINLNLWHILHMLNRTFEVWSKKDIKMLKRGEAFKLVLKKSLSIWLRVMFECVCEWVCKYVSACVIVCVCVCVCVKERFFTFATAILLHILWRPLSKLCVDDKRCVSQAEV